MLNPGDIVSHAQMCMEENLSLQKGMNYKIKGGSTIILMSRRKGAPYNDRVENDGKILIYEGHDVAKNENENPKEVNQELKKRNGTLTENGKFAKSVEECKTGEKEPLLVKVYEKIKPGIWVYNGVFSLMDYWQEKSGRRNVYKFKLEINELGNLQEGDGRTELQHNRMIPTSVKLEVWKRDKGKCVQCGSTDNLHFDHILPFSKGGTSLKAENIQLLCARHNLSKSDKII